MTVPWFYLEDLPAACSTVALSDEEARHASGARRLEPGDAVSLFDGRGGIASATIVDVRRKGRDVLVDVQQVECRPPLSPLVTVASAVPKGDRLATLLSMLAQLGVQAFQPLRCQRSVAEGGRALGDRGQRIIIEACKQARCAWAMRIDEPISLEALLERSTASSQRVLLAEPGATAMGAALNASAGAPLMLVVGPEGGFTPDELEAARAADVELVSLGRTILRIETACVAMASAVRLR